MQNMKFRYKVGEEVFISSRHEGIMRVKIVSQIEYDSAPHYELDKLVEITKNGDKVGSSIYVLNEAEFIFPESFEIPCPEWMLFKVGDKIKSAISNLFGGATEDTLTQDVADRLP